MPSFTPHAPALAPLFRRSLHSACLLLFLHALQAGAYAQTQCPTNQSPQQAPTGVTATAGKASITISWGAVDCATSYTAYRLTDPNGSSLGSSSTTGTTTTFTSPSVYNGVTYYFYVVARNSWGAGPRSATVSVRLTLDAPSVTAVPGKASITVYASAVGDADQYKFCKSDSPSGLNSGCSAPTTSNSRTYVYSGVKNGLAYNFWAYAVNAGGDGEKSNTATAPLILAAPSGVTATIGPFMGGPTTPGDSSLTVTWGALADADSYRVCREDGGYTSSCKDVTGTSYTWTTSTYSTRRYVVQVRGQNAAGSGYWSAGASTADGSNCTASCSTRDCEARALDGGGSGSPYGGSHGDPVDLATGRESYFPGPDLSVYNPAGPAVTWERRYYGAQAVRGYASPGFSPGWTHTYDVFIQAGASGAWGALVLKGPSGGGDTLTPVLGGDGQPTGAFNIPAGSSYFVRGVPGASSGVWQSVTITFKDQTEQRFTPHASGVYALTRVTSRTGQSIDLLWGGNRALSQVSDSATGGALLSLAYAGDGRLSAATDAYGRQVVYTFGPYFGTQPGFLQSVSQVAAAGEPNPPARWSFSYTGNYGQLLNTITVPSPTGSGASTATINYDDRGRVTSLVDANGNRRAYTYNSASTLVQVKDPAGAVVTSWTQWFSTAGQDTGVTDADNKQSAVEYGDPQNPGKPTRIVDRNGKATTFAYDQHGNVLGVTSPRGVTTTYTYNYAVFPLGRLTAVQEGAKPATTFTYYEPSGLLQSVTRPSPSGSGTVTNSFTYDSLGNVLTATGPGNNAAGQITTTYNYTADGAYTQPARLGQPLTVTDNLGHATHLRYDAQGRVMSTTDALGHETSTSYNLAGQVGSVTLPATDQTGAGRGRIAYAYLYGGGPLLTTTVYDESNSQVRQVTRTYGLEGEPLSVTGSTEPVSYTYDALYRLKTLRDGNNNATTYGYNTVGRLASVQMPGGETVQFPSYDPEGNLLQRIDGNNMTTNYLYNDAESLLTDVQYPATPALNVHFGYDPYGRRNSMTDGSGTHAYVFGNADELRSATTTYTGLPAQAISYAYYPDGSRQAMTTPAGTFTYGYDAAGRPAGLTNPFAETSGWTYLDNNWLRTQQLGNDATTTYTYNALGQMIDLVNKTGGGATLSQFGAMTHDGAGNRTSVTANIPGLPSLSGMTTYQYDAKDQLTQELTGRGGGFTDTFAYDAAGNPTSFRISPRAYNANNQQFGADYAHDGNGNPTAYNGVGLSFDPENRLTAYGSAMTAGYRGDNLRAWKQAGSGRIYFLYDGTVPVLELDAGGTAVATNTFGAVGLLSRRTNLASSFYTFDPQGSVAQTLDTNQGVISSQQCGAHGRIVSGLTGDPFGYKAQWGYYTDQETGLLILTYRYYDPAGGRFLTRDPISYRGGINLYAYAGNNPINFIDPLGLQTIVIIWSPVGNGVSSFGHVSIIINGRSYSWGPAGGWTSYLGREGEMDTRPADEYLEMNRFRNGIGYELDLTPEEEEQFKNYLDNFSGTYALGGRNCTKPVYGGLEHIGRDLGEGLLELLPDDLRKDLLRKRRGPIPLVKRRHEYRKRQQ